MQWQTGQIIFDIYINNLIDFYYRSSLVANKAVNLQVTCMQMKENEVVNLHSLIFCNLPSFYLFVIRSLLKENKSLMMF